MAIISQILDIVFSPITICIKFIKQDIKDIDEGLFAFLGILCWLILALSSGLGFAFMASATFLKVSFFLGYLFSIYFLFKIHEISREYTLVRLIFYVVAGIICGYTFGVGAYFFLHI